MRYIQRRNAVVFRFSSPTPQLPLLPAEYQWMQIDHGAIRKFFPPSKSHAWHLRAYPRLIDNGYLGFLLHNGKEWAAVQWIATPDSHGPPHLPAKIAANRYWCFYEHTREQHRQLGLWRALKAININYIRNTIGDSNAVIYSDTLAENVPSRHAHQSFGFKPFGTLTRLSVRIPKLTTLNWGSWDTESPHPN